ncbi:acyl-CoA thioesterase [Vibrio cincinnatiensis]|uniref:acyl-CoA thioesterase n=1 Tax=Vibrio cincinnatiensis TaxID=675 RepID=UPI001EDF012B|nr:acyl-CoA thioesterase [Vibrio cincinnatiensis]MCG3733033.1 acyl-CoA thioesterase [Vibrio cincinnatiensis]MCG3740434.1 acyl-CoA thioesterase [Vibrio cincinnatiensis]MCG3743936.1 acyl-CoA thioesterase [Vibrio cincinnatiensis]
MSFGKRDVTLRFLAEPGDVNFGGKVHGGAVMKWIDLAAYACAAGWSGKYCITAYAGGIRFVAPIHVGNLVEVNAKVICTGKTSIHVAIDVQASDPTALKNRLTTHCIVIMVAVDEQGKPTAVPEWIPTSPEDIELRDSAIRLMNMRTQIGEEMEAHVKYLKTPAS